MPFAAAGHRTEGRIARRIGRPRLVPPIAVIVALALASCVTPPPAPGSKGPERPGSRRPVQVVRIPPRPGSAADSAARADSIRAVVRAEAEKAVAARAAAERAEEVRVAAERAAVERAAAQRAAAERADSIRAANERAAAEQVAARRAEARRADSTRAANERAAAGRAAAQRAAAGRAAEERAARALLDSLRAAERATVRQLDSLRAVEQAVAARAPTERAPAEQTPAAAAPAPAARAPAAPTAAERAAAERQAAERTAAARAAAQAAAAERTARERVEDRPAPAVRAPRDPDVGIVDGPSYRVAGRHTFRFAGAPPDERVAWTVLRYTRAPDGEAHERRVASERGEELELDLEAVAGGESRYLLTASAGPIADTAIVWAFPPDRLATFTWRADGHPDVRVWTTVPRTLSRATRLVVVMHDDARDAVASAVAWERWAAESDRVVIAPEFDAARWPGERAYALGNLFASDEMTTLVPEPARSYAVVEAIARGVGQGLGVRDPSFDLWGHGAGAEFVHRFLLFRPRAPVRIAVAANADWYTLPNPSLAFPAGVKSDALDVDRGDLVAWTRRMLVVMRGTADTLRTGLPARAAAEAQGRTRFERAGHLIETAKKIEPRVAWWLLDVPGAGHDAMEMAPAAQLLLERMP